MMPTMLIVALLAADPSVEARDRVREALKCVPGPRLACATQDDELGEVETTYFRSEVIHVQTAEAGLEAWVERSNDLGSVIFHYALDGSGNVRGRTCHAPEVTNGMPLSKAPIPYQLIEGRVVFKNPCDLRLSCFEGSSVAKSFAIQAGHLVDERAFTPAGMTGDSFPGIPLDLPRAPCGYASAELTLPDLPIVIEEVTGWVGVHRAGKAPRLLTKGSRIVPSAQLVLMPGASLVLRIGKTVMSLPSADGALLLVGRPSRVWTKVWPLLEKAYLEHLPRGAEIFGSVTLGGDLALVGRIVFEVEDGALVLRCGDPGKVRLEPLEGFHPASVSLWDDGDFFVSHAGKALRGRCQPRMRRPGINDAAERGSNPG